MYITHDHYVFRLVPNNPFSPSPGIKLLAASVSPIQTDQPPLIQPQVRRRRRHSSTTSTDSGEDVRLKEAAVDPQDILGKGKKKQAVSANE